MASELCDTSPSSSQLLLQSWAVGWFYSERVRFESQRFWASQCHWCFHCTLVAMETNILSPIFHYISTVNLFVYHTRTSQTSGKETAPFLLLSPSTWISPVPAELRESDVLWEYVMTSVFPSQAVSFQLWNLSSTCGQIAHILHLSNTHCHASRVTNSKRLTLGHCWLLTGGLFVIANVVQTRLTLPGTPPPPLLLSRW